MHYMLPNHIHKLEIQKFFTILIYWEKHPVLETQFCGEGKRFWLNEIRSHEGLCRFMCLITDETVLGDSLQNLNGTE